MKDISLVSMDRMLNLGLPIVGCPIIVFTASMHGLSGFSTVNHWRNKGKGSIRDSGDGYGSGWSGFALESGMGSLEGAGLGHGDAIGRDGGSPYPYSRRVGGGGMLLWGDCGPGPAAGHGDGDGDGDGVVRSGDGWEYYKMKNYGR